MTAPSAVAVAPGHNVAAICPVGSIFCGETTRVVSFDTPHLSPRNCDSVTLASVASLSGARVPRKVSNGTEIETNTSSTTPIFESELFPDAGANTEVAPPSVKNYPILAPGGNAVKEVGKSAFHRKQAGRIAPKNRKCSANSVSGRWTASEHDAFLKGLKVYGREWKKVARCIQTRTSAQIRSHAQKYFAKLSKERKHLLALAEQRRSPVIAGITSTLDNSFTNNGPRSQSFIKTINSMVSNPSAVESRVCRTLALLRERYKQLQDQLEKDEALTPASHNPQVQPGPATAALEAEQMSLRNAAAARHEVENQEREQHAASEQAVHAQSVTPIPPSHSTFDSSDVIALSQLGDNLGCTKKENKTIITTKSATTVKLVRERPQFIAQQGPTKMRKLVEAC